MMQHACITAHHQVEMKEEDRLAAVVTRIDEEAAVVPRGAYVKTAVNEVTINRAFQGKQYKPEQGYRITYLQD